MAGVYGRLGPEGESKPRIPLQTEAHNGGDCLPFMDGKLFGCATDRGDIGALHVYHRYPRGGGASDAVLRRIPRSS